MRTPNFRTNKSSPKIPVREIGDASSSAFPWKQSRIGVIVNNLKSNIKSQRDGSTKQYILPFINFSSPNADYEVTTTAQVEKSSGIVGFQERPPLIELRVDFSVNGSDETTNIGEQYKVMSTMTQIITALINQVQGIEEGHLRVVKLYAKDDESGDQSNPNSKRGKLYQAFIKKNIPQGWEMSVGPKSINLFPSFNESKKTLTEGAYDSIVTDLSKQTIRKWVSDWKEDPKRKTSFLDIDIDTTDGKGRPLEFNYVGMLTFDKSIDGYEVNGTSNDGVEEDKYPFIATLFTVNPSVLPQAWSKISMDVADVVRHEIEHLTQGGENVRNDKQQDDDSILRNMINDLKTLPKSEYYKLDKEVDAMLQGLYTKAKKSKKPFGDVINQYLDIAPGIDNEDIKNQILDLWRKRAKALALPSF